MKKRIKILYCIDQLNIGGTEKQLLAIIERLDRKLFEPYLVCLKPTPYFEQCTVDCNKQVLEVKSLFSLDGIGKLFHFSQYLRQEKIDIVQTFFFDSTVFGVLAAKLARVKKVVSCRRDMGFWYTPKLLKVLYVINLMTDRILVNSQAIKDNVVLEEHVRPGKIDVIYNGIDLAPFRVKYDVKSLKKQLGIFSEDKVIGIVANLNRRVKRVNLFVEAAALCARVDDHVSFIVVGDGAFREEIEKQSMTLGVSERFLFVGSQENVVPFLHLFDVGVLTSESEGFANSIIEYMANGLPVICSDASANQELITDGVNGFLIKDADPQQIANKVLLLCRNPTICSRMKTKNIKLAENFSWEKNIDSYNKYYSSVASDHLISTA